MTGEVVGAKRATIISTKLVYGSELNYSAGGNKGFRDSSGKLVASLNSREPGLLMIKNMDDHWIGKPLKYE